MLIRGAGALETNALFDDVDCLGLPYSFTVSGTQTEKTSGESNPEERPNFVFTAAADGAAIAANFPGGRAYSGGGESEEMPNLQAGDDGMAEAALKVVSVGETVGSDGGPALGEAVIVLRFNCGKPLSKFWPVKPQPAG